MGILYRLNIFARMQGLDLAMYRGKDEYKA